MAPDFDTWCANAVTGDRWVYFSGHLSEFRFQHPNHASLHEVDAAWRAALRGKVALIQRRCGAGFEYLAVRGRFTPPNPRLVTDHDRMLVRVRRRREAVDGNA